jgi:hypothetical protein
MILVAELTEVQKDGLVGQLYATDSHFNPIQDINGTWIISLQEVEQCNIQWVKELPLIEFTPINNILT